MNILILERRAPSTSGSGNLDVLRSLDLAETALRLALGDSLTGNVGPMIEEIFVDGQLLTSGRRGVLLPGGNFAAKVRLL